MSIPALLLFIFAPVLGLLFAPLLSAIVRVRAVAVLSALIVAASLSVSAPAEAGWKEKWRNRCNNVEWGDAPKCRAFIAARESDTTDLVFLVYQCLTGDDGKTRESVILGKGFSGLSFGRRFDYFGSIPVEKASSEKTDSGVSHVGKILVRWDEERVSEGVFFKPENRRAWFWQWGTRPSDWRHWEKLEMTPTALPNPIRLLQTKSQLRTRRYTFSLAGAAEAIAEAKRHCGL